MTKILIRLKMSAALCKHMYVAMNIHTCIIMNTLRTKILRHAIFAVFHGD